MEELFKCPVCGNQDPKKIGIRNGQKYCRACLSFVGNKADLKPSTPKSAFFQLKYELSDEQRRVSIELLDNYIAGNDSLLNAVTGSGKTEIVFRVIRYVIEHGGRVGFAIPRRDVAIELYERLKSVFKLNKVVCVYGGHNEDLDGDIICLTTHQLYRYPNAFDLLIVDEIDAFPYNGNAVLETILTHSIKGRLIMMSATPNDDIIQRFSKGNHKMISLNTRYHGYPLPVPEIILSLSLTKYVKLVYFINSFLKDKKQVFIFAPTIEICEKIFQFVYKVNTNGAFVHSKHPKREEIIADFKKGKYGYLVTTAVLERGVTVKDLQVIVFQADHRLYDHHALIQIAGRAGRKIDAPTGRVIFLVDRVNEEIKKCIETIKESNRDLQNLL